MRFKFSFKNNMHGIEKYFYLCDPIDILTAEVA